MFQVEESTCDFLKLYRQEVQKKYCEDTSVFTRQASEVDLFP